MGYCLEFDLIEKESSCYYTDFGSFHTLNFRCNICSQDIDEKEVENHASSKQHQENKSKIPGTNAKGSDNSVISVWLKSLND